jgi:hypothetical protein
VKLKTRNALLILLPAAFGVAVGCTVHVEPAGPPPVAVDVGAGPVVYDDYYWRGYYDGPYFFWYGRDGHLYHEVRADHERRERLEHRAHAEERHDSPARHEFERGGHEGEHRY